MVSNELTKNMVRNCNTNACISFSMKVVNAYACKELGNDCEDERPSSAVATPAQSPSGSPGGTGDAIATHVHNMHMGSQFDSPRRQVLFVTCTADIYVSKSS